MRKSGFTLIEMLIVVAVIGILAGTVLVSFGPVQRQARDARRLADLKQAQNVLGLYYNKCGYYPGAAQAGQTCAAFAAAADWTAMSTALTGSALGPTKIPNDPSGGKSYAYGVKADGSEYVLRATLEDAGNPNFRDDGDGTIFSLDCEDANKQYCIVY